MIRLNLLEIRSTIIETLSDCIGAFLNYIHAARYPVWGICDCYTDENLLLKLFLMVGFNPNAGPADSPLERVVKVAWPERTLRYYDYEHIFLRKVLLLLEYGANMNYQDIYDSHPIAVAVHKGWNDVIDFLIKKGVDVNSHIVYVYQEHEESLLQSAYMSGNYDTALLLIDKGADFEYSDIPRIFGVSGGREPEILCAIYNRDSNAVGELLQRYRNEHSNEVCHDKIEPIFRNVLSKHILPKVQNEQIKNQLNNFLSGTDNSVEDISAQADIQNDLQNSRERQDEVVTIENISKAQKETEGLSISSN